MSDLLLIVVGTALVNNFVLVRFLGLCPFLGVSTRLDSAVGLSLATAFVLTLSAVVSHAVHRFVLVPLDLAYLRTISFILVIAAAVQLTELVLRATSPLLQRVLGLYLPLITTNCAVLGVALLNVQESHGLLESAVYGLGAAAGFSLVLVLFAGLRERIAEADVPEPFRGPGIGLVTAGLMALAFMGFTGLGDL